MVCAGVISGLVAPTSPDDGRWETLWHYMQSGPGVFKGDLHFYMIDGDIRGKIGEIDITRCPLYLLTGEYDYSCTPEGTLAIAERTGAPATIMKGLGHFPMSEDPEKFNGLSAAGAGEDQSALGLRLQPQPPERLERIGIERADLNRPAKLDGHHNVVGADRGRNHLGAGRQRLGDVGEDGALSFTWKRR